MKRPAAKRQRGIALIALLAVIALGTTWMLLTRLNAESNQLTAITRARNAEVLNRAKQALIGYVAAQAAKDGENNPAALPCPENPGDFNSTTGNDGKTGSGCGTSLKVGRFPWRTIGVDKLVDAYGEPLWYVVSTNWGVPTGGNSVINSNSVGQLTVDGVANDAVAVIIAPGPAITVATSTGCTAWTQTRPTTGTPDWRNYLECENATNPADSTFVTTDPSGSFNDQVVKVTAAELLPGIEAAIAQRMEREIVPKLNSFYAAPSWGLSGSDKIFPYAVPFSNPETSSFTGSTSATQGFLPLVYTQTSPGSGTLCTPGASAPRCSNSIVGWPNWSTTTPSVSYTGAGVTLTQSCSYFGQMDWAYCNGTYIGTPTQITITGKQTGATALRSVKSSLPTGWVFWFDLTSFSFNWSQPTPTSFQIASDGMLNVSMTITPPAPVGVNGVMYWLYIWWDVMDDNSFLESTSTGSGATGWFLRNEWHKLVYYAIAPGYTAAGSAPRSCADTGSITCLQVTNLTDPAKQRAILVVAGRKLGTQARPGTSFADYLDTTENQNGDSIFAKLSVNSTFNDRFVSVSKNP